MPYTFSNLSPADFEDLVRDLLSQELGVRLEGFGPGPDGGIDGRHATAGKTTVIQAKHYFNARFTELAAAMRRERTSVDLLNPDRYILGTSRALTPPNKRTLAEIIGPSLKSETDILGATELNALLRKFPDIETSNIKLWLSSAAVLERVLRSASHEFTATYRAEIEAKVKVYAQNPSFKEARDKLEANHVVIISGPPGVGKTTLAEMLAYAYIGEEWEFIAIRGLDDGFGAIADARKQVFFFDDFLGKIALDARALASKDSELTKFIRRIRQSRNARFILTTRAYIFEDARRVSEHLADTRLDITKYLLDVGIYTRRIKARILYNHLFVAQVPQPFVKALWNSGSIQKIVDHRNYNPRVIEAMTDNMHIQDLVPADYPVAFLRALDNPTQIWDVAFRSHISPMCQHLLYTLFFGREPGIELEDLKPAFEKLHHHMCRKYSISFSPKDFDEALKVLEGGFVYIRGRTVSLINPSLRDYLATYISDVGMLSDFAATATMANWAAAVWRHARDKLELPIEELTPLANHFVEVASKFSTLPVMKRSASETNTFHFHDMSASGRIAQLIEWATESENPAFMDAAFEVATRPPEGFDNWQDAEEIADRICTLRTNQMDLPRSSEIADALECALLAMATDCYWGDDVERLWRAITGKEHLISTNVFEATHASIVEAFDGTRWRAQSIQSVSLLEEQMSALKSLAPIAGISDQRLQWSLEVLEARIEDLQEESKEAPSPTLSSTPRRESDKFDNKELANLFSPLAGGDGALPTTDGLDEEIPF